MQAATLWKRRHCHDIRRRSRPTMIRRAHPWMISGSANNGADLWALTLDQMVSAAVGSLIVVASTN